MATAFRANNFVASHAELSIRFGFHRVLRDWFVETRPATARFVFGLRVEKWIATPGATIHPRIMGIRILAGKRALGPFLAEDVILLRRQRLSPFLFCFLDF